MSGLEYQKKGRIIGRSSSPRDLQKRNSISGESSLDNRLVLDLLSKVSSMTLELEELKRERVQTHLATVVSTDKKYTEEEFNEELINALEKELESFKLKLEAKDDKICALELKIEAITELNSNSVIASVKVPKQERPSIEDTVIDPTESKVKLDSHINIKEVEEEKTSMENKVGKLKALLGG